jgi:hypothetical protein
MIHSTIFSKNRRSLDRRISFSRPASGSYSSITLSLPTHSPPIESSLDHTGTSLSSRSVSVDRGSKGATTDRSPVIAKQLFPESQDSIPTLSKQEARQLQRKELSQKSETTWKSTGIRTRSGVNKSIPKLSADTKSVNSLPQESQETKKKVEKPSATSVATRTLRSSSLTNESAPQHSSALQSAAQKAVAIFASRISKKTSSSAAESSSQPKTPSHYADRTPKRTSQVSHPKTPQYPTSAQKTKTPSSGLRSSMTSASTASVASSTSSINVQRTNSGSSLSTASSQRRGTDSGLSTTSNSHVPLKSATIKASGGHHFKPKSVTVATAAGGEKQKPTVAPPTLRGGGGKSARGITSTSSNVSGEVPSSSSTQRMKGNERTKPTVPVSALQSKKSFDEQRTRQMKQLSSSHSSVRSEEG